jgi:tetratricopeptide (TPR) repeat protein
MKHLEPPDSHYLSAAEGWLGLGDWKEAVEELKKIPQERRRHPEALEVLREILAQAGKWKMAAEVAGHLVNLKPEAPDAWIALAYATRRKDGGGLKQARGILVRAQRLAKAFATGRARELRAMALEDRDLEPLWGKIREQ